MELQEPLYRRVWNAAELMERHPPRWRHSHKRRVAELTCPEGCIHAGQLEVTRWAALALPEHIAGETPALTVRPGFFGYEPAEETTDWYLNFADPILFGYYEGALLAQDELQVLEHPALGAIRGALGAANLPALTVERGNPTPVLIRGVERRAALDTTELYGNRFADASFEKVQAALTVLEPPTVSNILALAAPSGGYGFYKRHELEYILRTAYTGFAAARAESVGPVAIHTGFWGCGAFGGNRTVMTMLQLLAARLAGIDTLVFHAGDRASIPTVLQAQEWLEQFATPTVGDLLNTMEAAGFRWGVSDGN
jgi:hypothetical protein